MDHLIFREIEAQLDIRFATQSRIISQGRTSIAAALEQARKLVYEANIPLALIAATDSLLTWPQLQVLERDERLLTARNSNGFIPGEAGGALLVGRPTPEAHLSCLGIGFGIEKATVTSEQPLRGDGLVRAIREALSEAGCGLHDLDFRITDVSGEHYYFKEAALALGRVMRKRKRGFDIWHAAECTGEVGAASGVVALSVAYFACGKGYAPGPGILFHSSSDAGERAAAVLRYGSA
jgi:3-oxoacyl-[acyl-carrier-protein] synthase-1